MQSTKIESFLWCGREDTEDAELGLRWHQVINQSAKQGDCTIIGFACDLGVTANKGRAGAVEGPNAIRSALANFAFHADADIKDIGNIVTGPDLDTRQTFYADRVAEQIKKNRDVIGLGGGHEIAWGSYQGLEKALRENSANRIGIINFDAHFDLRKPSPTSSSGTPFRQIAEYCNLHQRSFNYACLGVARTANTKALFEYAEHTGTRYLLDEQCDLESAKSCLTPMLENIDHLYVTICLDAFPAHLAPGVSAPSALGISAEFVIRTLRWLVKSQKDYDYQWKLTDIAEMNPKFDIDGRTAKLAARIVFELAESKFGSA